MESIKFQLIEKLAQNYVDDIQSGHLHERWFRRAPFPHAVLPNFFKHEVYEELRQSCLNSWAVDTAESIVGKYGVITDPRVVMQFYGKEFRQFLNTLIGKKLERAPNGFPQVRVISRERHGLGIHNDAGLPYDIGLIFHMTRDWDESVGGCLKLWAKTEQGNFKLHSVYPPKENTLVVLQLGESSYHSVEPLKRDHERVTLVQEWKTCSPAS